MTATTAGELLTPRLRLRRWRDEDAAPMAAINRDPEVVRYLQRPLGEAAIAAFHGELTGHWERHGFGLFALESREPELAGALLGFTGISLPSYLDGPDALRPELGWRLARAAWGRGLATEAAFAARDHALTTLGMAELIAVVHPGNERSRRVAAKLGMEIERQVHHPVLARDVDLWVLRRPHP